jgi:murein DD-endopeptidase MepM/ murein hydrolase activator NlpD
MTVVLAGCWLPEDFAAEVVVNRDGSYTFKYDGTLTFAMALAAATEHGLTERDEAELAKGGEELRRSPGFKSVDYQGKGRYKVLVETIGIPGEPYWFLSRDYKIFAVETRPDGTIRISAARFSQDDIKKFKSIGARVNGTLSVSVAKGMTVVEHNAQAQPTVFGLFGSYKWNITTVDADPYIVVRPSPDVQGTPGSAAATNQAGAERTSPQGVEAAKIERPNDKIEHQGRAQASPPSALSAAAQSADAWAFPVTPYTPGSYGGRGFYYDKNHLGEDIRLSEGAPVHAIGPGKVVYYGPAPSYGELVAAVEHDLGGPCEFIPATGTPVKTDKILSIYGHIRPCDQRSNGTCTGLSVGSDVTKDSIIGYINDHNDDPNLDHNGDSKEHLHLGIRLSSAEQARMTDGGKWLRGYVSGSPAAKEFAAASVVIPVLRSGRRGPVDTAGIYPSDGTAEARSEPIPPTPTEGSLDWANHQQRRAAGAQRALKAARAAGVPDEVAYLVFLHSGFAEDVVLRAPPPDSAQEFAFINDHVLGGLLSLRVITNDGYEHINKPLLGYLVNRGLASVRAARYKQGSEDTPLIETPFLFYDPSLSLQPWVTGESDGSLRLFLGWREFRSITYGNQYEAAFKGMQVPFYGLTFDYVLVSHLAGLPQGGKLYKGRAKVWKDPSDGEWKLDEFHLDDAGAAGVFE